MKFKADRFDVYELMADILGTQVYEGTDEEYEDLEEAFYDRFYVSAEDFATIVDLLVPRIQVGQSPLTKTWYRGFTSLDKPMWLVRMKVEGTELDGDLK